ncbi:hypothetical protein [Magnetospirillum sp. UT-4]|uniref:hypothetical protein n=1 Tax=Magnetospirillum sp. UT-4 TaxID=2681467 RepID=UPI001385F0AB|nr:hypothetical protein [Magnetospirillum sp. UT-4]CAA7625154.1 exported hypothetical protein [Magnetospirillum sp. UT-4]
MTRIHLLSAVSAVALGAALVATPAAAFDTVNWSWSNNTYTDLDAFFDIDADFDPWGLTQVERLQVMAGNMSAFADGSYATYPAGDAGAGNLPPIYIFNIQKPYQENDQNAINAGLQAGIVVPVSIGSKGDIEVDPELNQYNHQYGVNIAKQYNTVNIDLGNDWYKSSLADATTQLAKVEIAATAASNVATVDGEHATFVHDGQIAFGKFDDVEGGAYHPSQDQAGMAGIALGNLIGWDLGSKWTSEDDMYGTSGNSNYDVAMLAWTSAQYGMIKKGYNSAVALGDGISNAQADVSATSAANIHTVSLGSVVEPGPAGYGWHQTLVSENVAVVDLTQFGYQDNYAHASATNHMVSGFKNLGKLDAPVLNVSATALGNVSSVTNKFVGPSVQ